MVAAAKALRRSTRTINKLAEQLGVIFRTHTPQEMERREAGRNAMIPAVTELADQGLTQREICERLGITRSILRRIAEENWIDIDNRSNQ